MLLVMYQAGSSEGRGAFTQYKDQLTVAFDHIGGEGNAYDLWGIVRRLLDQGARKRLQGGASVAGRCYARDGIVHVQSEELALEYHLKLMAGRMVEFNMKGGKKAVQDGPRDNDCFCHRNERLRVLDHKKSVPSNRNRTEIALNIPNISKLLGWACALIKVGAYSTKAGTVVLDLPPG